MTIKPENRFWIGIYGATAFIMLVAMGVFGWLAWTSRNEPGIGRVAGGRRLSIANSGDLPDEQYRSLASFEAPPYRRDPAAPKPFQAAMAQYAAKDYDGAASALRMITDKNPDFAPARFYLGIALLLSGSRIAGIEELRALTEAPGGAYLERARFYLAKALIGEHDIPRAQKQLEAVIERHGDLEKKAAALLAQLRPAG